MIYNKSGYDIQELKDDIDYNTIYIGGLTNKLKQEITLEDLHLANGEIIDTDAIDNCILNYAINHNVFINIPREQKVLNDINTNNLSDYLNKEVNHRQLREIPSTIYMLLTNIKLVHNISGTYSIIGTLTKIVNERINFGIPNSIVIHNMEIKV